MSIAINALSKKYGGQTAVDDISFKVSKGEIVGFLGPNGAGKSTTMKILTGYLKADGGNALVCNMNVNDNQIEIKKKIGYLSEANPLYYEMYVREYLDFIAGVHALPHKKQRISEVLDLTGLAPESRKKTAQLSKGYKQRVGLAAALIHDPEVLILDEPTSGLDPNQIIEIRELIKQLGKDKTVLFSSHILQEVQAICDRVVIINQGRIVADDKLTNLQQGNREVHVVLVQFREPVRSDMLELNGVTNVQELPPGHFKLHTATPEAVQKQLLALALQNNLNIVSLQSESRSLEEVFRGLTTKNQEP